MRFLTFPAIILTLCACQASAGVSTWEPSVPGAEPPASGFILNTSNRGEVLDFHNRVFRSGLRAESVMGWTGNYSTGVAGSTSTAYREHMRRRVNYYRALAGLPADISFDSIKAQNLLAGPAVPAGTSKYSTVMAAALMNCVDHALSGNFELSHDPPSTYWFYTTAGWHGCRYSNLAVGYHGPEALDAYMLDNDINDEILDNKNVGHRRWILYPRASDMSSGDVPDGYYTDAISTEYCYGANALYILGTVKPAGTSYFTSWPNAGWCPSTIVPARWSLSYPGAGFAGAAVSVAGPAGEVPTTIISNSFTGVGDNTIVFIPTIPAGSMLREEAWTVKVTGITGTGVPSSYSWTTRGLNEESAGLPIALTGPAAPPAVAAGFSVTTVPGAGGYALTADAAAALATFTLGAEDAQAADVVDLTSDSYALRETTHSAGANVPFSPRTGTRAFHMAFPNGDGDQVFEIAPQFLLSATSRFEYYDCFRWLFTNNSMSVEMSVDGGAVWNKIGGRNGRYTFVTGGTYNTGLWDKNSNLSPRWVLQSIDLAGWAGKVARFRFILRAGGNGFDGVDGRKGCYIDDISLTNVRRLTPLMTLTSTTPSFALDSKAGLVAGNDYVLRAAPVIGGYRMAWCAPLSIQPTAVTGVNAWIQGFYPSLTGGITGDHDHDTLANVVEYALGSDPTSAASGPGLIPSPVIVPGGNQGPATFQLSLPLSGSAAGISVSGEYSCDLVNWLPVANTGMPGTCTLCVPVDPRQGCGYFRVKVGTTP